MKDKEDTKFNKREKWMLRIAALFFLASVILQLKDIFN
jgi:hypothetical protein